MNMRRASLLSGLVMLMFGLMWFVRVAAQDSGGTAIIDACSDVRMLMAEERTPLIDNVPSGDEVCMNQEQGGRLDADDYADYWVFRALSGPLDIAFAAPSPDFEYALFLNMQPLASDNGAGYRSTREFPSARYTLTQETGIYTLAVQRRHIANTTADGDLPGIGEYSFRLEGNPAELLLAAPPPTPRMAAMTLS